MRSNNQLLKPMPNNIHYTETMYLSLYVKGSNSISLVIMSGVTMSYCPVHLLNSDYKLFEHRTQFEWVKLTALDACCLKQEQMTIVDKSLS